MDEIIEEYGGALIIMIFGLALIESVIHVLEQILANNFIV